MAPDDDLRRDGEAEPGDASPSKPRQHEDDELRFEGPISLDEEYEDEDDGGSGSRTFLLTAIIAAGVIIIVAAAFLLRSGGGDEDESLGLAEDVQADATLAEPGAGDTPAAIDEGLRFRSVPAEDGTGQAETAAPATTEAITPAPNPTPTPTPKQAQSQEPVTRQEPASPPPRSTEPRTPARVGELARAGNVDQAADMGRRIAASGNPSHYTLQVLFACVPGNVQHAFTEVRDQRLTVLPAEHQGRSCYRLCWGDFASADQARAATATVPTHFTSASKPVPRPWGELIR